MHSEVIKINNPSIIGRIIKKELELHKYYYESINELFGMSLNTKYATHSLKNLIVTEKKEEKYEFIPLNIYNFGIINGFCLRLEDKTSKDTIEILAIPKNDNRKEVFNYYLSELWSEINKTEINDEVEITIEKQKGVYRIVEEKPHKFLKLFYRLKDIRNISLEQRLLK